MIAFEFGLLAGVGGAAIGVVTVAYGFSAGIVTIASISGGLFVTIALDGLKNHYLDAIEDGMGK